MISLTVTVRRVWPGDHGGAVFTGTDDQGQLHRIITSKGIIHRVPCLGECWTIHGSPILHARYGVQIHADQAVPVRPRGELLMRFLAQSKAFQGVGEVRSRKLWDAYGEGLYGLLDSKDLSSIAAVLGEELATSLLVAWEECQAEAQVVRWLEQHGFPVRLATKVMRLWGVDAPEKITENPYRMLSVAEWTRVDAVALDMGVEPNCPERHIAAVETVFYRALAEKHTVLLEDELLGSVRRLLNCPPEVAQEALALAEVDRAVVRAGKGLWQALGPAVMEGYIRDQVQGRVAAEEAPSGHLFWSRPDHVQIKELLASFCADEDVKLTDEQEHAVWLAMTQQVSLVMGGAGTGKTTFLKAVHYAMEQTGGTVHAVALAGRAAMRMREATGRPARTLAGFLGAIQRQELVLGGADLLVVDEASMVDLPLAYALLRAIPFECRVLLVGDPYQLPPIGFGIVFAAYCEDDRIPKVELTKVHRQAAETGIPFLAGQVRSGRMPDLAGFSGQGKGISFLGSSEKEALDQIIEVLGILGGPAEAQILGAVKRGPAGIKVINEALHGLRSVGKQCWKGFSPYDPVIYLQNDYDRLIWNGTLGLVESVGSSSITVCWDDHEHPMTMTEDDIESLDLAYGISVHKAQGSQFKRVIVPVFQNRLLERTLIYTAITRATEQIVLLGDRAVLEQALAAPPAPHRRRHGLGVALPP